MFRQKCSFCGVTEDRVAKLVTGPKASICDHCVTIADRLVNESGDPPAPPQTLFHRSLDALGRVFETGSRSRIMNSVESKT